MLTTRIFRRKEKEEGRQEGRREGGERGGEKGGKKGGKKGRPWCCALSGKSGKGRLLSRPSNDWKRKTDSRLNPNPTSLV